MTCSGCGRESAPGERQYAWGVTNHRVQEGHHCTKLWCPSCWQAERHNHRPIGCYACGNQSTWARAENWRTVTTTAGWYTFCPNCPEATPPAPSGRGPADVSTEEVEKYLDAGMKAIQIPDIVIFPAGTDAVQKCGPLDGWRFKRFESSLGQVQAFRQEYEAEFGCCPACGRFDGVSWTSIPSDIVLQWSGRIDFETLPDDEREMRALAREKLQPAYEAIMQAWRERKNGQG